MSSVFSIPAVLSIAGSDSSGGAGIQADIKTIAAHGLFAETAITAVTAQNTCGVRSVQDIDPGIVADQIDAVFEDIRPAAVKIGMVSSVPIIEAIADRLAHWDARNIVLDPVMVATSGARLIAERAERALGDSLFELADIITPNIPETEALLGLPVKNREDQEKAAETLASHYGCAVLVKGGHNMNDAADVLAWNEAGATRNRWFMHVRIDNPNTHGTGCTLSSAIACGLARGLSLDDAVNGAKRYISGALMSQLDLGRGAGPLDHMWQHRGA